MKNWDSIYLCEIFVSGETPAAMQHGNNSSVKIQLSQLLFAMTLLYIIQHILRGYG